MAIARAQHDPFPDVFHPAVREWLGDTFPAPTRAPALGWPQIVAGNSTLILAPTGSGKTLAAFLAAIDRLMFSPVPERADRCRVVYVSPLRALAFDVERNLRAPIAGIARVAGLRGDAVHIPTVGLRTGDTEARERARMARTPPDILITTPESLFLVLTSNARAMLRSTELVIVDEIHTLAGTKRGAHLALTLERLAALQGQDGVRPFQRIGLSATQRPLDEVARYLGGGEGDGDPSPNPSPKRGGDALGEHGQIEAGEAKPSPASGEGWEGVRWTPRPISIVDAGARKAFDLRVEVPVEDMSRLGRPIDPLAGEIPEGATSALHRRSIWPAIYPRLLALINEHRSTIVFVNSRRLAERVANALNELAEAETPGREIARAHHGSVAREQRLEIEDLLKLGKLPAMVATSSLELGIDMGAVDLVVQIETPPSVASGMQRIGRAGHHVESVSRGVVFPKYRGDLLATAAIARAMMDGAVEATRVPQNPLDVLTQHVVAACALDEWSVEGLYALARRAAPFAKLSRAQFESVLDMLSGRYPSDEFAELRPRITWDRLRGTLRAREGARQLVVANAGTIPDRGLYGVFLADSEGQGAGAGGSISGAGNGGGTDGTGAGDGGGASGGAGSGARRGGRRVGELDEEMVFETREGEVIVLGASSWRVVEISRDRVLVAPAAGEPGKMPFWKGDRASRPVELGEAIGRLTRELSAEPTRQGMERLTTQHGLEPGAADNLLAYLADQRAASVLPDDRTIVIERTRPPHGDWRICILSPWGGRVHAPWALAIQAKLRASEEAEAETVWSDDGIVIRLPDRGTLPETNLLVPDPDEIEDLVVRELGGSSLFAGRFREAAGRALLVPRRRPGQRSPLWMQRKRAADLLAVASRYGSFPIVLETYSECLQDVFDLPALIELARKARRRELRVQTVDTDAPSPFAATLLFDYVANYIYDGDAPLAERRAQALSVDLGQLRDLLGEADLRELLDLDAIEELDLSLQGLVPGRRVRTPDRLHDLLLRLGDLTPEEVAARVEGPHPTPREASARPAPYPYSGRGGDVDESTDPLAAQDGQGSELDGSPGEGMALSPGGRGLGEGEAQALIASLEDERRVIRVTLGGEERVAAVEDAGRLRDAFGVPPPPWTPRAFLVPHPTALRDVVARYARTHGPFQSIDVARRYGMGEAPVLAALGELAEAGRVIEGELRPGGSGREWCDTAVLGTLRRRSLARLRKQVEPADPAALGRLLVAWHGIATTATPPVTTRAASNAADGGPDRLLDAIEQLQGAALAASTLETDVLPARIPRYRPRDLDLLCAAGEVVWLGAGPLGERDGRVRLYLTDALSYLHTPSAERPTGDLHDRLRAHLARYGASFFADLHLAAGGPVGMALDALWDLVWAGEVTNDSPAALRAYLGGGSVVRELGRRGRSGPFRSRRQAPPSAVGRWSLVDLPSAQEVPVDVANGSPEGARAGDRVGAARGAAGRGDGGRTSSERGRGPTPTERARALAEQLIARHGILTRGAVLAEGVPGGFSQIYPVLASLEEAGRLRRGYFLAGLGGAQFAQAGALERLRDLRDGTPQEDDGPPPAVVLNATDPANPYGAALPWPVPAGPDALKPMRAAGAYVALVDGALALYVGRGEKEVTTFLPADEPARATAGRAAALAIARWAAATGRVNLAWAKIDGRRATGAPLAPFMAEAGVVPAGGGFRIGGPESGRFGSLAGGRFRSESRVVGGDEG